MPARKGFQGFLSLLPNNSIVYSSGEMHAELQATYSDHVGCASYPPRSGEPTVIGTLESLRDQIAWRHRLFGSALGMTPD